MMFGRFPLGGWTPLAAGVPLAWFDASIASSLTIVSGKVSSWASRVGSYTIDQATAGQRPTYSTTGYRSKAPAATFSNANSTSLRAVSGGLATYMTGSNIPVSIAIRMQCATPAAQRRLITWEYSLGSSAALNCDIKSNGHLRVDITSGGTPIDSLIQLTDASLGTTVIVTRASTFGAWVSDTQGATGAVGRLVDAQLSGVGGASTSTSDTFALGINTILGNIAIDAAIVEVILWPTVISTSDVFAADAYLAAKWG